MPKLPQTDRHQRGYRPPKRRTRTVFNIYLEHELAAQVRALAAHDGVTIQDTGEELFRRYVREADNRFPQRQALPAPRIADPPPAPEAYRGDWGDEQRPSGYRPDPPPPSRSRRPGLLIPSD